MIQLASFTENVLKYQLKKIFYLSEKKEIFFYKYPLSDEIDSNFYQFINENIHVHLLFVCVWVTLHLNKSLSQPLFSLILCLDEKKKFVILTHDKLKMTREMLKCFWYCLHNLMKNVRCLWVISLIEVTFFLNLYSSTNTAQDESKSDFF